MNKVPGQLISPLSQSLLIGKLTENWLDSSSCVTPTNSDQNLKHRIKIMPEKNRQEFDSQRVLDGRIIEVAKGLPEWFTDKGIEQISEDLKKAHLITSGPEDNPTGFIIYDVHKNCARIEWMAVSRRFHRKKVGTALINELTSICEKKSISEIRVTTLGEGDPYEPYIGTRAFYRAMGFKPLKINRTSNPNYSEELELRLFIHSHGKEDRHVKVQADSNRNTCKSGKIRRNSV